MGVMAGRAATSALARRRLVGAARARPCADWCPRLVWCRNRSVLAESGHQPARGPSSIERIRRDGMAAALSGTAGNYVFLPPSGRHHPIRRKTSSGLEGQLDPLNLLGPNGEDYVERSGCSASRTDGLPTPSPQGGQTKGTPCGCLSHSRQKPDYRAPHVVRERRRCHHPTARAFDCRPGSGLFQPPPPKDATMPILWPSHATGYPTHH